MSGKSGTITLQGGGQAVDFELTGSQSAPVTLDLGLDDIGIGIGINGGAVGSAPLAVAVGGTALPLAVAVGGTTTPLAVTVGGTTTPVALDLGLSVTGDSKQPVTLDLRPIKLDLRLDPVKVDLKLEPIKVDLGLDNINVCLSFAITEFPQMRVRVPIKFDFGFSLFGLPLVNFGVCGETGFSTENIGPRVFSVPYREFDRE